MSEVSEFLDRVYAEAKGIGGFRFTAGTRTETEGKWAGKRINYFSLERLAKEES